MATGKAMAKVPMVRMSTVRKSLFLISFSVTIAVLLTVVAAGTYFAYTRPQMPDSTLGRTYPYQYHYTTVYLTKSEQHLVGSTMNLIGFWSTAVTVALGMLWRRDLPFGWSGRSDGSIR